MPAAARPRSGGDLTTRTVLESLRHIVRALRVSSRAAEAEVGLSGAQLFVLQRLAESGVLSLGELATRTLTHQSSVSVVVQRLVDKRLVARRRAAHDARRYELAITLRGRALLDKAPDAAQKRLIAAIEKLAPPRRSSLARDLRKVVVAMELSDRPAALFFEEDAVTRPAPPAPPAGRALPDASAKTKKAASRA